MKLSRAFLGTVLLAGVVYGGWVLWHSSALELRRVEVAGNHHVTKEELAAVSGLAPGTHLLLLSTKRVADKIESLSWVRDVRVERIIPSRVRITVTERTSAARVVIGSGSYLADEEGVVLEEGNEAPILVTGLPLEGLMPGDRISVPQYRHALSIVEELGPSVRGKLKAVKAPTVDGITLELSDGITILYGAGELLVEKNFAIEALMNEAESSGQKIATIDVRVPRRPAIRLR